MKEILEIKKQFRLDNLTKIATAYVSPEKERFLFKPLLSLPEEESFKYLEIFKKCGAEETEEFIKKMEDVISLSSIVDKNKLAIEVSGISLKVPMNQAYQLEIKEINGRSYFCLPVNENHINGIPTKVR